MTRSGAAVAMRALALVVLALVPLLVPASGALAVLPDEHPTHGACDAETGLLVCTGADAGGSGSCSITPTGYATCETTFGWFTEAFSPAGLPGEEAHAVTITLTRCESLPELCSTGVTIEGGGCRWLPGLSCGGGAASGMRAEKQLVLGECLKLVARVDVATEATALVAGQPVSHVAFHNGGEGGAATCHLDDGR